jgi:hypothetical protein
VEQAMTIVVLEGARDHDLRRLANFSTKEAAMASTTPFRSHTEIVREYTQWVFNEHNPDLAPEYLTPEVTWHGGTLGTVEGLGSVKALLLGFIGAPPDLHAAVAFVRSTPKRRRCGMRQAQISKKPRAVAACSRRQRQRVLPLDLRDPDIVRAKALQRRLPS